MFKGKGKDKPEPTCWLFLGSGQNIGGYASKDLAMREAREEDYEQASIYADPQGEMLLYYQHYNPEKQFDCGCATQDYGWRNAQTEQRQLAECRTKLIRTGPFCKKVSSSGIDILHMGSMERAQRLIENPPFPDGGVTIGHSGSGYVPQRHWNAQYSALMTDAEVAQANRLNTANLIPRGTSAGIW